MQNFTSILIYRIDWHPLNLLNDFLFYFFSRLRFWEIVNWKTFVEFLPSSMHTVIQQTDTALHIRHRIHIPIRCGSSSSRRAQSLTIWIFTFGPVYRDKVLYCSPSTLTFSFSMYLLLFFFFFKKENKSCVRFCWISFWLLSCLSMRHVNGNGTFHFWPGHDDYFKFFFLVYDFTEVLFVCSSSHSRVYYFYNLLFFLLFLETTIFVYYIVGVQSRPAVATPSVVAAICLLYILY